MAVVTRCALGNEAARLRLRPPEQYSLPDFLRLFIRALETRFVGAKPALSRRVRAALAMAAAISWCPSLIHAMETRMLGAPSRSD